MILKRVLLLFIFLLNFSSEAVFAQKYQTKGQFLDDTLKIGYPMRYALSIEYPSEWQIFFPDSTSDFGIFEYYSKKAFKTSTKDSLSTDSVIYELMSFELDSVQGLALPVFRLYRGDTIELLSNADSIMLKEYIEALPPELDLKENALLRFIPDIFNKKLFLIVAGVILVILALVAILFGKKILGQWKIYRMTKKHKKFLEGFDSVISESKNKADKGKIELANATWKNYLSELEKKPYNTYSTRDFIKHLQNEELVESLKKLDAFVYGGYEEDKLVDRLIFLKHFAEDRFEIVKKEVQNA